MAAAPWGAARFPLPPHLAQHSHHLQRLQLALLRALHPLGHLQPARLESSMRRTGSCQLHRRQMHCPCFSWKQMHSLQLCRRTCFSRWHARAAARALGSHCPRAPQPPGPCCPSPPSDIPVRQQLSNRAGHEAGHHRPWHSLPAVQGGSALRCRVPAAAAVTAGWPAEVEASTQACASRPCGRGRSIAVAAQGCRQGRHQL